MGISDSAVQEAIVARAAKVTGDLPPPVTPPPWISPLGNKSSLSLSISLFLARSFPPIATETGAMTLLQSCSMILMSEWGRDRIQQEEWGLGLGFVGVVNT